jgi:hypothetical protein
VTRRIEEAPAGYPGFLVMRPPRIAATGATLKGGTGQAVRLSTSKERQ